MEPKFLIPGFNITFIQSETELETQCILDTVLSRIADCFSSEAVAIGLLNKDQPGRIQCYLAGSQAEKGIRKINRKLLPSDLMKLHHNQEFLIIEQKQDLPDYLSMLDSDGIGAYLDPVVVEALMNIIYRKEPEAA